MTRVSKPAPDKVRRVADMVRRVVLAVVAKERIPRVVWGTVSAVSGQTCTFTQDAVTSTPQTNVTCLPPYVPTNGDVARGEYVGTDFYLTAKRP